MSQTKYPIPVELRAFDTLTEAERMDCVDDICYEPEGDATVFCADGEWYSLGCFVRFQERPAHYGMEWDGHSGTSYYSADIFAYDPEDSDRGYFARISW